MLVLYADPVFTHHKTPPGHPECAARAKAVVGALGGHAHVARCETATSGTPADAALIHDPDYIAMVERIAGEGGGGLDADTVISPASYRVALDAVGTSLAATRAALGAGKGDPARLGFAAVRPPGHHARPARGMGFCLFNNVAIAAASALKEHGLSRVSVVDFDVHHGNGTQDAFYDHAGVQYVSLHGGNYFPGTGLAEETGAGDGLGTTLNLPLVPGVATPDDYQEAFRRGMDAVIRFKPELLLISAGFDAFIDDPIGGLDLEEPHFRWIGAELRRVADASCEGRAVALLEGGYALEDLGNLAAEFVTGLATGKG